ncbi:MULTISPECIES: hypothetical protein [Bacillus cereus group]|uniref:Uncharacterized protein n=1 Tax=Bacillus mycoides TaxID=1405 RepID=A0A1D3MH81_BACMY|nr:hypothetical protein [Bacillus mycoides]MBJ8070762.1 hypothetical protein [Bacillus cereus]MBJ8190100.1 hypothetical protein [Bacillus cereus]OFE00294.1 hypothetical protein BWGOE11_09880 [Bacillus mycoides]OFE03397.1 hypothetical protein BWGOE13_09520 [Bacillus mycoides]OHX33161.1 hypothetical protein BWGOE5_09300 [Bacillus mycoides]
MSRKKIWLIILLVFVIALGVIGYKLLGPFMEGRRYYYSHTDFTDLSNESIGKMKLHDNISKDSFREQYGEPISKQENVLYDYYSWKNGVETASIMEGKEKGKIVRLIIGENTDLKTAKGIGLGSTKQDVISSYGSNYYERTEQGTTIIGYADHKLHTTIEFWLGEGKVGHIRLDDADVE